MLQNECLQTLVSIGMNVMCSLDRSITEENSLSLNYIQEDQSKIQKKSL